MMINCKTIRPQLSEFLDDHLDARTAWAVQTHVVGCAECARIQRELSAMRQALRTLPAPGPSAGFDAALAERLALTRRPASSTSSWKNYLTALLSGPPVQRLRPALALGFAAAAVSGILFLSAPTSSVPTAAPAATHTASVDHVFVAECVAQRRREAAGEPLADLAAQNLAGHLDAAPAAQAGVPSADAPTADAEMF